MNYTVGQMAKRLGVAPSTLRYYDKEGLLPFAERTKGGIRTFREEDFEWLQVIKCLKKTGMSIADIRIFIEMAIEGDTTVDKRLSLIRKQKEEVEKSINGLKEMLKMLEFKEWYYKKAKEAGTTAVPRNMKEEELPQEYREVRKKLRGEI